MANGKKKAVKKTAANKRRKKAVNPKPVSDAKTPMATAAASDENPLAEDEQSTVTKRPKTPARKRSTATNVRL